MGALHEGHLKLVKESKNKNDVTVVSIFVNPVQFSPNEDLAKYPRPFENDKKLLSKEKVDYLFYPNAKTIYPVGFQTYITAKKTYKYFFKYSRKIAGIKFVPITIVRKKINIGRK